MLRWTTEEEEKEEEEEEQRRQREMENLPGQFGTFRGYSNTICDFNVWHGNPELKHLTTLIEPKLSWHGKLLIYCLRSVESCIFLWTVYSLAVRTFCKVQAKSNFNILKAHLDSRTSARTSAGGPADICRRTIMSRRKGNDCDPQDIRTDVRQCKWAFTWLSSFSAL
jgi:hypothetical protein